MGALYIYKWLLAVINSLFVFVQTTDGEIPNLNLGELDLTTDEFILDEVDSKAAFFLLMPLISDSLTL